MRKCTTHHSESVVFVCLDPHCNEPSRLLCSDCAIFTPNHKDHLGSIMNIDHLFTSSDGSSLKFISQIYLKQKQNSPIRLSKQSVNMYFDILQQQIFSELQETRLKVLSVCELQDQFQKDIASHLLLLEARISCLFESDYPTISDEGVFESNHTAIPRNRSLSNLQYPVNNSSRCFIQQTTSECGFNLKDEISSEISTEILNFHETAQEATIETELLVTEALKACKLHLSPFEFDLDQFLAAAPLHVNQHEDWTTQQTQITQSLQNILNHTFNDQLAQKQIQLLSPADFYTSIGYQNCIAVNSIEQLPLLKRVSSQVCCEIPSQRQMFFSLLLDNKDISDNEGEQVARELHRIRYISNIHLDLDDNSITDVGYTSIFKSLNNFIRLEHLDLRFNRNFSLGNNSTQLLADLLEKNKSSLRVLCLTMRQLRAVSPKFTTLSDSFSALDSSSSTSRSSFSMTPQYQQQQSTSQFTETVEMLMESIKKLSALEVLYLDFSDNSLSGNCEGISQIFSLPKLSTVHLVFNRTALSGTNAMELIQSCLKSHPAPFEHMKLFLKDNGYSFQHQRSISGQYQKIKASTKNFDIFH